MSPISSKKSKRSSGLNKTFIVLLVLVGGCSAHQPVIELAERRPVDLAEVPFYPQEDYQCGPAALATLLGASEVPVTPEQLVPQIYVPQRRGSFQIELIATTRKYARIPYVIDPDMDHLLDELDMGRPVLVLQNLGVKNKPIWHYAVVNGYDPLSQELYLRSGTEPKKVVSMSWFYRTWQLAGMWALVALKPSESPANLDQEKHIKSVVAMETVQSPTFMLEAYSSFAQLFPNNSIAALGLANAYLRNNEVNHAIRLYHQLITANPNDVAARNNLAMALGDAGCYEDAVSEAQKAIVLAQETNIFLFESEQTLAELIEAKEEEYRAALDASRCELASDRLDESNNWP